MKQFLLRMLSLGGSVLLVSSLAAGVPVLADDDDNTFTDQTLTYERVEGGVRVIGADSGTVKVTVTKEIDGYPVVGIGEYAFSDCAGLTSVELQPGIKTIETGAFSGCTELKEITIPDTVTSIGDGAFYYCGSLEEINIPDSVTEIGSSAFAYCFSLEKANIPAAVQTLPSYAFYYDYALREVTLNEGLETIEEMAFVGCYFLEELHIPASVTEIAQFAVVSCAGIQRVTVGEGNVYYQADEDGVLLDRTGKNLILYPAGRTAETYTVPDSITDISPYAFAGALNLVSVILPDTITEIGEGAFSDCRRLEQLDYPHLKKMENSVLANCVGLKTFTIPDSVTEIGDYTFYGCGALTEITIPDSVTEIGAYAFFDCTSISEITVPDTVTSIGEHAFGYQLDEDGEAEARMEGFVLHGKPRSAAKDYAGTTGVKFKQDGIDGQLVLVVVAAVLAVLVVILLIRFLMTRPRTEKVQTAAEDGASAVPAPEEEYDPNYTSILGDDETEEDPYDRSYGFSVDSDDDETEDANDTESDSE